MTDKRGLHAGAPFPALGRRSAQPESRVMCALVGLPARVLPGGLWGLQYARKEADP